MKKCMVCHDVELGDAAGNVCRPCWDALPPATGVRMGTPLTAQPPLTDPQSMDELLELNETGPELDRWIKRNRVLERRLDLIRGILAGKYDDLPDK